MRHKVFVYSGEGAGHRSVQSAQKTLEESLSELEVHLLGTTELLDATWCGKCALLCMPGGADLPYCRDLNGRGNQIIEDYVRGGGAYLGLCAGAYYACSRIEFEPKTCKEVRGKRELSFFPGLARGAVYPGFAYDTEAGSRAALICYRVHFDQFETCSCRDYSNGGPCFLLDDEADDVVVPLAHYMDGLGVAAVRCKVGNGVAVLCGTHPELPPSQLESACSPEVVARTHPDLSPEAVHALVEVARHVQQALLECARERAAFWQMLLAAAGLPRAPRNA